MRKTLAQVFATLTEDEALAVAQALREWARNARRKESPRNPLTPAAQRVLAVVERLNELPATLDEPELQPEDTMPDPDEARLLAEGEADRENHAAHAAMVDVERDRDETHTDPESCPGCGCRPGEGTTEGCEDADGCGYLRALAAR